MALGNAKRIIQNVTGWTAVKLLLLTARLSRPAFAPICTFLLAPFVTRDEIQLRYKQGNRSFTAFLRGSDQESDLHSVLEVVVRKVYPLDPAYRADLVIDGGANVGLFALQAAACYPSAKLLLCEPLPRNISQLERHLDLNHVSAQILPVCIGGLRRTIPFYCREANSSSFDGDKPYTSLLEIDVLRLNDILAEHPAERILIKLDIEGMEVEALEAYIPTETRCVVIFAELHRHPETRSSLERLLADHGWSVQFGDLSGDDAIFEARSPAAIALAAQAGGGVKSANAA